MTDDSISKSEVKDCRNCKYGKYNDHFDLHFCYYEGSCEAFDKWVSNLPSVQSEHTMEEFMYGQDMGNPEDGSL